AVQGILRVERSFVAIKGRLSGSTDGGRLFFIPYQQIDYLGSQNEIKDAQFHETFGRIDFTEPGEGPAAEKGQADAEVGERPPPSALTPPAPRPAAPIRSAVLERFRARTASSCDALPRPAEA